MKVALFKVEKLNKSFGERAILNDISLEVMPGEILGIWGLNSSSKTMLMKALGGILPCDSGAFYLDGVLLGAYHHLSAVSGGIMTILGEEQMVPGMSVADNLFLGCKPGSGKRAALSSLYSKKQYDREAVLLLKSYHCEHIDASAPLRACSAAQRTLVLILHAIAHHARVLLVDDCFIDADENERRLLIQVIRQAACEGIACIIASQNIFELSQLTENILTIRDGTLSGRKTRPLNEWLPDLPTTMYPKIHVPRGNKLYQCSNLSYRHLLRNISLTLHEGEIVGIIGASGSGRSLMAKVISGYVRPTEGEVMINRRSRHIHSVRAARKCGISLISSSQQLNNVAPKMHLDDNIFLGNYNQITFRRAPFAISGVRKSLRSKSILRNFGIQERADTPAGHLSSSVQKKISFARSIVSGSQIVLLDEPTAALDPIGKIQIYNIINSFLMDKKGIILFTSDISEARSMCDRIIVLKKGEVIEEYDAQSISVKELYQSIYC